MRRRRHCAQSQQDWKKKPDEFHSAIVSPEESPLQTVAEFLFSAGGKVAAPIRDCLRRLAGMRFYG
jgi:hypothetical protein